MKIFHELIVDDYISAGAANVSSLHWAATMGNLDVLRFFVIVDRISGTSATITMFVNETPTMANPINNQASILFAFAPLTSGQPNLLTASISQSDVSMPASYSLPVGTLLGGIGTAAHIRIWVTGRGIPPK